MIGPFEDGGERARADAPSRLARVRARAPGLLLAFAIEAGVILLLVFLLVPVIAPRPRPVEMATFVIDSDKPDAEPAPEKAEKLEAAKAEPAPAPARRAPEPQADVPPAAPPPPPLPSRALLSDQSPAFDLARVPDSPRPAPSRAGPVLPSGSGSAWADTPRVAGSGPNGEPLYAASWYREPYDAELRGYLSTASGPGWGLIACRTVREYRVADCIGIDEYPAGSGMLRAVLAAAWQFRVRPPRLRGELRYGEWVRIRIDYTQDR